MITIEAMLNAAQPVLPQPHEITIAQCDLAANPDPPVPEVPPEPPKPLPIMTYEQLAEASPKQCPKCKTFVEIVEIAIKDRLPGYYCNKHGCGWNNPLPGEITPVCPQEHFLDDSLIEMVRVAPLNPEIRAQIHAILGKEVPRACKTSKDVFQWVRSSAPERYRTHALTIAHEIRAATGGIQASIDYFYRETGTCQYTCDQNGHELYEIDATTIRSEMVDCRTLHDLKNKLRKVITAIVEDDPPDTEGCNYQHDDYESRNADEYNVAVDMQRLEDQLKDWLYLNEPEEMDRLLERQP